MAMFSTAVNIMHWVHVWAVANAMCYTEVGSTATNAKCYIAIQCFASCHNICIATVFVLTVLLTVVAGLHILYSTGINIQCYS